MTNPLLHIGSILRGTALRTRAERSQREMIEQGTLIVLCVMAYGGVMGSWGLFSPSTAGSDQWLSSLYSALKVPLLLITTFLLSLPVLFVSYTLAGLRSDFRHVFAALMEMQSGLAIILGSLAPFTLLWYASCADYRMGILFNAVMFAVATFAAPSLVRRHYRRLVRLGPRHRHLLRFWIVMYVFIGIQMGWVLRPFIGSPGNRVMFFRSGDLDNAYVTVVEIIWHVIAE